MWSISAVERSEENQIQATIDNKTKPQGSLGALEVIAKQVAMIQGAKLPKLKQPKFWVFAGDHGVAEESVSAFPQEVTAQMVANFCQGGAAINVFCRLNDISLSVVDAGVKGDVSGFPGVIDCSLGKGTNNFCVGPAMSIDTIELAFARSSSLLSQAAQSGTNIVGFGEMGIANTTSSAALIALLTDIPASYCVGRGTGIDADGLERKLEVIESVRDKYRGIDSPVEALATVGGFEIAMMVGAMLSAAEHKMVILVDGFIASAAALVAVKMVPEVKEYMVFCHASAESGHHYLLQELGVKPLLDLGLRLGEGTGAALAFPLVQSAVAFYNEMASFDSAGVSQ
ncbi:nicotinate-nucleotide--dimethylbenzimidazole phosphoribosyltransferase [Corallincola platygyrae]|uniref:Nicotinate-nucleotide--dimethylbenzimidazole phosphoribosyltransferase n=1 Tax=Corallincola platygyrae TaxID=1193278 RepID=A0ABW4XG63_9GAMM